MAALNILPQWSLGTNLMAIKNGGDGAQILCFVEAAVLLILLSFSA